MITFYEYLASLRACQSALDWVCDRDVADCVQTCTRADWLVWLLPHIGYRGVAQDIAFIAADRAARIHWPKKLEQQGIGADMAKYLRALPTIEGPGSGDAARAVSSVLHAIRASQCAGTANCAGSAAQAILDACDDAGEAVCEPWSDPAITFEHAFLVYEVWKRVPMSMVVEAVRARMRGEA